jgi:restriction endonuclease Mrr
VAKKKAAQSNALIPVPQEKAIIDIRPRKKKLDDSVEISSVSILEFLIKALPEGVPMTIQDVDDLVYKHFKDEFSKADLTLMTGKQQAKWQNSVDWAKSNGAKRRLLATFKKGKQRYLLRLPWWLPYIQRVKKRSFKKKCKACEAKSPLSAVTCGNCGRGFPAPNARRRV